MPFRKLIPKYIIKIPTIATRAILISFVSFIFISLYIRAYILTQVNQRFLFCLNSMYSLIHIIFLSILESYDESFRELLGKRLAQAENLIIVGEAPIFSPYCLPDNCQQPVSPLNGHRPLPDRAVADKYLEFKTGASATLAFCCAGLFWATVLFWLRLSALLSRHPAGSVFCSAEPF